FTMAAGDSQEVVFGIFHAAGGDALASVAYLKEVDALAQTAYDIDFALPDSPPSPNVTASALADQIILVWDDAPEGYDVISEVDLDASGNPTHFVFEGYNVYQHETASGAGAKKRLATYDIVNGVTEIYDTVFDASLGENISIRTQFGSDSGLSHFEAITTDGLKGNSKLITNRSYYYSVTAYGYNADGLPKTLESSPSYLTVRPEVPNTFAAGDNTASAGDVIATAHTGPSQGSVDVVVVDASQLTGDDYTVTMDDVMPDGTVAVNWTLTNDNTGGVLIANNPVVGGVNTATGVEVGPGGTPVVEGIQLLVNGPQEDLLSVSEWDHGWKENQVLRDPAVSYVPWASLGRTGYIIENRAGIHYSAPYNRDFDRFNYWESDDVELDFSTPSLGYDYLAEWVNGYAPFSAYRHNFATGNKEQIFAGWWETDGDYQLSIHAGQWAGPIFGADSFEPIYCFVGMVATPYDPAKEAQYIAEDDLTTSGGCGWGSGGCDNSTTSGAQITYPYMTATLFTDYLGSGVLPTAAGFAYWGGYTTASSVVWEMSKPNSSADTFTFTTEGLGMEATRFDPDRISVWPNPYYGYNPEERDALDRRVMFSHLPTEGPATIRIFALDGTLVRTIHHNDTGSQHATWDMKNNFELPVASGMYLAHVETNLGDKILKLAVIQPEQRLDVY
ncbi:MAG TPA: T9SS type A sorting domain-containing protein, partial [Candidatus Marinimicrobia bacterium]|nr:T9SS type A sorting domain-containing protein [Candidatus Neomarinimicrobiota bacterium]